MVSKNFIGNNSRFKTFHIFVLHTTIALSLRSVFEFEVRASWSLKRVGLQFLAEIYRNPRGEENNCCKTIFCWPLWNLYFVRFVIESSWYTSWCNPVCFKRKIKNDLMTVHITTHTLCNTKNHFSLHFLNSHITLNFNFKKFQWKIRFCVQNSSYSLLSFLILSKSYSISIWYFNSRLFHINEYIEFVHNDPKSNNKSSYILKNSSIKLQNLHRLYNM